MKHPLFSLVSLCILAACAASNSASYVLTMDVTDPQQREQLAQQSLRVIERRLERMGEIPSEKSVTERDNETRLSVTVETREALDQLAEELQRPFSFMVMTQAEEGEEGEISVEGHGSFVSTGITGDDLEWVEGGPEPGAASRGQVRLVFTDEGRSEMADLFARSEGKMIGIFVRDQLISKLLVDTNELKDDIVIRDIPSPELAQIFAEDVNVGLHVTFTPVP